MGRAGAGVVLLHDGAKDRAEAAVGPFSQRITQRIAGGDDGEGTTETVVRQGPERLRGDR